ncbi:MAG: MMPL family transporter [Lachnospiraceae bacterium]|nr:MMPL family transporter [Lachnospiraceae bacterium]
MNKIAKLITKHKNIIMILAVILLIPSAIGYISTRINYDVLSYLPDSLETVEGQDILVDEFGMGAFSMVIVEDMSMKDAAKLEKKIENIDHVTDVLWYDDALDISVPTEMMPKKLQEAFFNGDATMMIALFDDTTSADDTMGAITEIRKTVGKSAYASGMSGVVTDIKNLALQEMPIYVIIAACLSLLVLMITMDSLVTPLIFLATIGMAIVYNLGSNRMLGEISYITQALAAVLQLAVTMDYSIFLLESYEANKLRFEGDKQRAMSHAIMNTFKSVSSSSVTTIAGFVALCVMTFKLGANIGIVMSKGVIIGVIACVTVLPAMILTFDGAIEKTSHKALLPNLDGVSKFVVKHYRIALLLFVIVLFPAAYGNANYEIYYNIDTSLPKTIPSAIANEKLSSEFDMSNMHMVLLKNENLSAKQKSAMSKKIEQVDGVKWVIGLNSLVGANLPESMIPNDIKEILKTDNYELMFVCSDYKSATDEVNAQIADINDIVKGYQKDAMVIGEAPLMKDLSDVTDVDLKNVNTISIVAIFLIILVTFKSISIPCILVAVIEFAIACNMSVPFYTNTALPFVASIVIGTIQLGATVDYAILMTNRYHKERVKGAGKKEAIAIAHRTSIKSIVTSGLCFFAATFGVCVYSKIDMISSICALLARGAVISMIVVIAILPAMLWIFDGVIIRTSWDMIQAKVSKRPKQVKERLQA